MAKKTSAKTQTKPASAASKKQPKYIESELKSMNSNTTREFMMLKNVTLSKKQKELFTTIKKNKIVIATGPAGTSKTFTACYAAINLYLSGFCDKIIITKPTQIVGSSELGHLPGTLEDKLAVYEESFMSNFAEIIQKKDLEVMRNTKDIEYKPVQFVRGATFKNCVVIIDEFQSFDIKELMAIITRLGKPNCKMVFIGDINQNDIAKKFLAVNILKRLIDGINDCATFEFDRSDIVRDPILIEITDRYDKFKEDGELPETKKNT